MRNSLALVLWLLSAVVANAQAPSQAVPTRVEILVLPSTGDPATVAPVASRVTPISATSALCNQPIVSAPAGNLVNPQTAVFDDPFTPNRTCRVPMPTMVPDGTGYRGAAVFIADTCNPTGQAPITPCPSPRSAVGLPPFSIVSPKVAPLAPTGLQLTL